jgi:hypothetical protein
MIFWDCIILGYKIITAKLRHIASVVHQLSAAKVGQDFHAKFSKLSAKNSAMGKRRDITLEEKT